MTMTNVKYVGKISLEELTSDMAWLDQQKCGCCYHEVAHTSKGTTLCIVVGWEDGFSEAPKGTPYADGTWRICAKVAYQHANNVMQCDYDIDWRMPYDKETGDVDDTSTEVSPSQHDVDWLNEQAERVWKDWRLQLDKMD